MLGLAGGCGPTGGSALLSFTTTQATLISAQATRRERTRRMLVQVHVFLVALTAPGVVAVYALHLWLVPSWQFAVNLALALAMCLAWLGSWALARAGRLEASTAIFFVSVWAMSNGAALLRENTLLITLIANLGSMILVWVTWPRAVLPAGALSAATVVAIRALDHLGLLPQVRAPPVAELLFDVALLAVVWPVVLFLLRRGAQAAESPMEMLETAARRQEQLLEAVGRVQPVLSGLVQAVETSGNVVASGASQQAATAAEVATATRRLEETVQLTGTATEKAREIAEQTRANASATRDDLEEVDRRLHRYLETLRKMVAVVEAFADRSQKTDDVIAAIEEVHARVKILAINAAIEAIRAGEAGKGIGVVASELRSLITGTEQGLRTGRDLLAGIRHDAEQTARGAGEAARELEEHLGALRRARDLVDANLESFSVTGQSIETIAESSTAQREQIALVSRAMNELRTSADELTRSAEDLLHSMRRMTAAHGDLDALVQGEGQGAA
jgi:methyl-accepting chemotaxis protein